MVPDVAAVPGRETGEPAAGATAEVGDSRLLAGLGGGAGGPEWLPTSLETGTNVEAVRTSMVVGLVTYRMQNTAAVRVANASRGG